MFGKEPGLLPTAVHTSLVFTAFECKGSVQGTLPQTSVPFPCPEGGYRARSSVTVDSIKECDQPSLGHIHY